MNASLIKSSRAAWALGGWLLAAIIFERGALGQSVVNAGTVQVSTLGHVFSPANEVRGPIVQDFFIDQSQSSGGGGSIGTVSANFDTNNQFTFTIKAPPGKKFSIRIPPSGTVRFGGRLFWSSPDGYYAYYAGSIKATFSGLGGIAPTFGNASAQIAQNHLAFGFTSLNSSSLSGDLSFSAITLTGTAVTQNIGSGPLSYHPSTNAANEFYAIYAPPSGQSTDPGRFVSLVSVPTLQIKPASSGVTVSWPTNLGNWVLEAAPQGGASNNWSVVTNSRVVSGTNYVVTPASTLPSQYYRVRKQ